MDNHNNKHQMETKLQHVCESVDKIILILQGSVDGKTEGLGSIVQRLNFTVYGPGGLMEQLKKHDEDRIKIRVWVAASVFFGGIIGWWIK